MYKVVEYDKKWDYRFLSMAELVSSWSKDPSTKTGAVIVSPDRTVVSVGYNGFPSGMIDDDRYKNRQTKYELIVHSEMNAVIRAERSVVGCTLYTWPFISCHRCCVHMIEAGIVRMVAPHPNEDQLSRWSESFKKTREYCQEVGVEVIEYHDARSTAK